MRVKASSHINIVAEHFLEVFVRIQFQFMIAKMQVSFTMITDNRHLQNDPSTEKCQNASLKKIYQGFGFFGKDI